ncbi:zinc-dependent peptidase [Shewanella maritima]|uniref:Zinc-dependent peptidase n=1 Tax=Shewanella maritima TaxID=2520507 RepID=A0A411PEE5_9GAMM|nr:M90 family metallopeptidase [Shewanella maritima]QBF81946.1 zinc-dependent peptidase [Shewanella maritima]
MLAIIVLLIAASGAIYYLASSNGRAKRRRVKITAQPFPKAWRQILKRRFPYFQSMPTDLQLQLKKHIQVFVAEKKFVGCAGLEIDDEVKVTIAAQACLLLLNRPNHYYPKLKQILVYPHAFVVQSQSVDGNGVHASQRQVHLGESWENGKVILSWHSAKAGADDPFDGSNVVIHEFAHQLDQETGTANGAPFLGKIDDYPTWTQVLSREFEQLRHCARNHIPSLFDYYGATNPAEFFAVISETFFEKPQQFHQQHPDLYQELSRFYQLNPIHWH